MRPLEDLTLYAHGLLESEELDMLRSHVDSCAPCSETVRRLKTEGELLKRAAAPEAPCGPPPAILQAVSPRRRRGPDSAPLSVAGLAAAGVLLAILFWALFKGPGAPNAETGSPAGAAADDIDRLIEQLKKPSPLRQEIAKLALQAYGAPAADRLTKLKGDPALIDACRDVTPGMRAIERKLDTLKTTLNFRQAELEEVLNFLKQVSGLRMVVDAAAMQKLNPNERVTLESDGMTIGEALRLLCQPRGLKVTVIPEEIVLLTDKDQPAPLGFAPVRIPGLNPASREDVRALGSASPEERDKAGARLRGMGFAAEHALWDALDDPNAEVVSRAAALLRRLYSREPRERENSLLEMLHKKRITIDVANTPLPALLEFIAQSAGFSFVIDSVSLPTPEAESISFKVQDIVIDGALRLLLQPRDKMYAVVGGVVVITSREKTLNVPEAPYWFPEADAARVQGLLEDLYSEDPARQERGTTTALEIGRPALGPLSQGARQLDGARSRRLRNALFSLAADLGGWLPGEPTGVDLQVLTPPQKALLEKPVSARPGMTVKEMVEGLGIIASIREGADLRVQGTFENVPVGSILRAILRPAGLDFYLEGKTLQVDRAGKVRSALGK